MVHNEKKRESVLVTVLNMTVSCYISLPANPSSPTAAARVFPQSAAIIVLPSSVPMPFDDASRISSCIFIQVLNMPQISHSLPSQTRTPRLSGYMRSKKQKFAIVAKRWLCKVERATQGGRDMYVVTRAHCLAMPRRWDSLTVTFLTSDCARSRPVRDYRGRL